MMNKMMMMEEEEEGEGTREDVLGEADLDVLEVGGVVVAELLEDGPSGIAEGAEAVQDRPVESAHGGH